MPLRAARIGEAYEIQKYPHALVLHTLGQPEDVIWSSINQLGSSAVADWLLHTRYSVKKRRIRRDAAANIKLYIQQAGEFYSAAATAKATTAPLFYYYAFLNLAKARCEMHLPYFHTTHECYRHGISWRPDPTKTVNMLRETVSLNTRRVWHCLWEAIQRVRCPARNPESLSVRALFAQCPEVSVEYEHTFGEESSYVDLTSNRVVVDPAARHCWFRLSVDSSALKEQRLSKPAFCRLIQFGPNPYRQVAPVEGEGPISFESPAKKLIKPMMLFSTLEPELRTLNLITHLHGGELKYAVPIQTRCPFPLDQLIVLYTLMFWLGSLVRYDPHSLAYLREQPAWMLIDGFMQQSRIWLLELFEWELYQCETTLCSTR